MPTPLTLSLVFLSALGALLGYGWLAVHEWPIWAGLPFLAYALGVMVWLLRL